MMRDGDTDGDAHMDAWAAQASQCAAHDVTSDFDDARHEPRCDLAPGPSLSEVCRLSTEDVLERVRVMQTSERACMPRADYVETVQSDGMRVLWRSKVAAWLLEFEDAYGLSQETVAVAVNYMDRYLSQVSTKKSVLQLLGMAAIFVAAKLHEQDPISVRELRDLALGAYLESDIRFMELELLRVVQWRLTPVTAQACMAHLAQLIPCAKLRADAEEDAVTFLDVVIPEYEFLRFPPSVQAAAALLCSFDMIQMDPAVAAAWAEAVAPLGLLASPLVAECKARMLAVFAGLVAPPLGVECPSPDARSACVVSPTGVEDLRFQDDRLPFEDGFGEFDDDDDDDALGCTQPMPDDDDDEATAAQSRGWRAKSASPFQSIDAAAPFCDAAAGAERGVKPQPVRWEHSESAAFGAR